jgi:hypothetical protein
VVASGIGDAVEVGQLAVGGLNGAERDDVRPRIDCFGQPRNRHAAHLDASPLRHEGPQC